MQNRGGLIQIVYKSIAKLNHVLCGFLGRFLKKKQTPPHKQIQESNKINDQKGELGHPFYMQPGRGWDAARRACVSQEGGT